MSKHTPGPWRIDRGSKTGTARGISASARNIVNFNGLAKPMSNETEANARLIAAAPDLLDALRYVLDCIERNEISDMQPARAAIAKAEGREMP